MHISLVVSGLGAVVAAIGGGVLLARCFREPRGDLIAFSVAMLGLLVGLGAQTLGHATGFDSAMFRAMELGGQVVAPLALIVGLSEIAARKAGVRFCARLYIPALTLVAIVVLGQDQLAKTIFSKNWPDPAVFYQAPPNYVLEFAVGPAVALVAIIAVSVVAYRAGQPGWNAILPSQLMAGAAALLLAYPALAELAAYEAKIHLPVASEFAPIGAAAAALTWMAGVRVARLPLASRAQRDDARAQPTEREDDYSRLRPTDDGGVYRGGGLYRPEPAASADSRYDGDHNGTAGWRSDRIGNGHEPDRRGSGPDRLGADQGRSRHDEPDFQTGDFVAGDYAAGDFTARDFARDDADSSVFATGDFVAGDYDAGDGRTDLPGHDEPGQDGSRAQLFGQIAIFTLLEDRVDEFDQLTRRVVDQVRSREPDALVFIVHAVPSAPMQRILYEVYRDRSAYDWHSQQPHVKQFESDKRPYVLATNVIELGLQQAKVSPFPTVSELFSEPGYDTAGFERPDYLRDYGRSSPQPGSGSREYR